MSGTVPAPAPAPEHEYAVHPLRGLVCLSIVGMHLYTGSALYDEAAADGWIGWALVYARPGYESFFLLSGFFLAHALRPPADAYLSVPRLLARRLIRLAVPYWVAVLIGAAALAGRHLLGHSTRLPPAADVLAQLAFVQDLTGAENVSVVFWSMAAVIQFYLLAAAGYWAVRAAYLRAGCPDYSARTVRTLAGLSLAVWAGSAGYRAADLPAAWVLAKNAVFFTTGGLVYWATHGVLRSGWVGVVVGGLIALGLGFDRPRMTVAAGTAAALAWLTAHPGRPRTVATRLLAAVGRRSYSVYLTHAMVGPRVLHLYDRLPADHRTPVAAAAVLVAAGVAAVAVGFGFHRLVERPVARASRRIGYRR